MTTTKYNRKERIKKMEAEKGTKTRTKQKLDCMTPQPTIHRVDHPKRDDSPEGSRLIPVDLDNVPWSFKKEKAMNQVVQMKIAETHALARKRKGRKCELTYFACVDALPGVRQQLFPGKYFN